MVEYVVVVAVGTVPVLEEGSGYIDPRHECLRRNMINCLTSSGESPPSRTVLRRGKRIWPPPCELVAAVADDDDAAGVDETI